MLAFLFKYSFLLLYFKYIYLFCIIYYTQIPSFSAWINATSIVWFVSFKNMISIDDSVLIEFECLCMFVCLHVISILNQLYNEIKYNNISSLTFCTYFNYSFLVYLRITVVSINLLVISLLHNSFRLFFLFFFY